jgi:hypothetical protein
MPEDRGEASNEWDDEKTGMIRCAPELGYSSQRDEFHVLRDA